MHTLFSVQGRRSALALLITTLALTPAASVLAQDKYPSKPVALIVPQAAGGANDAIARVLAQKLTEQTGQSLWSKTAPARVAMWASPTPPRPGPMATP